MVVKPLTGVVVVALEEGIAAPFCSSRLADAGARVIKIEQPSGDKARGFDRAVSGESAAFLWANHGKESLALDLRRKPDHALLHALIGAADVFIQNLPAGTSAALGFDSAALRAAHPRLVTCDISGYGESGPLQQTKASELLVQADTGLVSISGAPGPWGRIGVPICEISAAMNALSGIQQALLLRERSGAGSGLQVSLFDAAADLMTVPYLQARYGAGTPERDGLSDADLAPSGAYTCADGRELVLVIRNDDEWTAFCRLFMLDPGLADTSRFASNAARSSNRAELDALIQDVFSELNHAAAIDRLTEAQTAFAAVNSAYELISHPQLRTRPMAVNGRTIQLPATPCITPWDDTIYPPAPALDEHRALPAATAGPRRPRHRAGKPGASAPERRGAAASPDGGQQRAGSR